MTYKIEKYDLFFETLWLYMTLFLELQIYAVFRN